MNEKTEQIRADIEKLREGGTIKTNFLEIHWFWQAVEHYKMEFELVFKTVVSNGEITLTGVKDENKAIEDDHH